MKLFRTGAVVIMVIVILCARQWYPSSFANIALPGWGMMIISYFAIGVIALIAESKKVSNEWIFLDRLSERFYFVTLWLPFYTAMLVYDLKSKK